MKPWFLTCFVAVAASALGSASAQTFPSKPLRIVAPSAPGATTDIVSRFIAQKLTDSLGQQVVVDNRPGAGGNVAAELVSKAPPDGHTLLLGIPGLATNPSLYQKLSYDPQKDFAPISLVSSGPLALVIHPALPVRSVSQLIALAKARPGELNFPSVGAGTTSHLSVELFKSLAKIDMVHVPYKNFGQAMIDLTSGRMSLMINAIPGLAPHIKEKRLVGLAVTSLKRTQVLPQLPTIHEAALPGYEVVTWNAILAPAGTPKEVVVRLNAEIAKALRTPDATERLHSMGFDAIPSTPDELAALIRSETAKWGKVIKAVGARVD
jgi:tripartite-type tricarboxylate transporter receptor subunit TctC